MGESTKIQWTDATFNPWIGCTKVSPGCVNCYAENTTLARRERSHGRELWGNGKPRHRTSESYWRQPIMWNRKAWICDLCGHASESNRRDNGSCTNSDCDYHTKGAHGSFHRARIFPSLCDWLDEEVPIEWLAAFLKLIYHTPNLDWLLLTKRPELFRNRIGETLYASAFGVGIASQSDVGAWLHKWISGQPPANIWIGVSVEDQKRADERIPELLKIPAKVRFLSVEPLLESVDIFKAACLPENNNRDCRDAGDFHFDWVIIGGESGPKARLCNVEWIRSIVVQCRSSGVPCFVKQIGSNPDSDYSVSRDEWMRTVAHPKGGDPSEWSEDLRVREFPRTVTT